MTVVALHCEVCGQPTGYTQNQDALTRRPVEERVCPGCRPAYDGEDTNAFRNELLREMDGVLPGAAPRPDVNALQDAIERVEDQVDTLRAEIPPLPEVDVEPERISCESCGCNRFVAECTSTYNVYDEGGPLYLEYDSPQRDTMIVRCRDCRYPYDGPTDW